MHHIQPEAQGGSDHFDNAIVLCFDCHADAGAYNPEHPRGTKITPEELRRARDEWYETVKYGNVEARAEIEVFHCRYIIGKNFDNLREITASELHTFPISNPLLINAPSLYFLRNVIHIHPEEYRWAQVYGDVYQTREDYIRAHADSELRPTSHEGGFQYFTFERVPPQLLHQGEYIVLRPTTSELILEGLYLPLKAIDGKQAQQPFRRNELVTNFRAVLADMYPGPSSLPIQP